MPRARDLGIAIGTLPTGPTNSVLDVEGVGLGHVTITRDTARTGVSCLFLAEDAYPDRSSAVARCSTGWGTAPASSPCQESGLFESPVYLTSTSQVGPGLRRGVPCSSWAGTRSSSTTSSCRWWPSATTPSSTTSGRMWVDAGRRPRGPRGGARLARVVGAAGGGVGRRRDRDVLPGLQGRHRHVVAGHPRRPHGGGAADDQLRPARPAHRRRRPGRPAAPGATRTRRKPAGSCIGVVVTDAPVDPLGCERLARRIGLGLARTGSTAHHGSGEIFLAVSTTARTDRDGTVLDDGRAARRARRSTTCSRRWSTPPRSRCSTRC